MKQLIETLKKDIAITFEPVSKVSLKFAVVMLKNNGFGEVPAEYLDFLKITNGLIWNGIELYGAKAQERDGKEYTFPGLVNVNMDFVNTPALQGRLVVGHAGEELLVYSAKAKAWQALDRYTFAVMEVAPSLEELLKSFMEGMV